MRKWIVALRIALGATLLFVGLFLFILGVFPIFYGSAIALYYGFMMVSFGGLVIFAGIMVVLDLIEARKRKWVIASGTIVFDLPFFYVGSSFLYSGVLTYLADSSRAQFNGAMSMFMGGSLIFMGIIVVLALIRFLRSPKKHSIQCQLIPLRTVK